jgi:hypothetical protein
MVDILGVQVSHSDLFGQVHDASNHSVGILFAFLSVFSVPGPGQQEVLKEDALSHSIEYGDYFRGVVDELNVEVVIVLLEVLAVDGHDESIDFHHLVELHQVIGSLIDCEFRDELSQLQLDFLLFDVCSPEHLFTLLS